MYSNFLQLTILKPARITGNKGPSLIDIIFTNPYKKDINSENL